MSKELDYFKRYFNPDRYNRPMEEFVFYAVGDSWKDETNEKYFEKLIDEFLNIPYYHYYLGELLTSMDFEYDFGDNFEFAKKILNKVIPVANDCDDDKIMDGLIELCANYEELNDYLKKLKPKTIVFKHYLLHELELTTK